jgi:hypothetical protein
MSKPNWDDAPEWANWVALSSDGIWTWFENKPRKDREGDYLQVPTSSRWESASERVEMLEQRP